MVDRVSGDISYSRFLADYIIPNRPCLISESLTRDWACRKLWATPCDFTCASSVDSESVNWEYLAKVYGDQEVTVADCLTRDFSDQRRESMHLSKAISSICEETRSNRNGTQSRKLLYIKDWHLILQSQRLVKDEDREPYQTPDLFVDDWLNLSHTQVDDFKFCYAGMKGSFTPLHRDFLFKDTSYSWSTNIVGTKTWRLFPPESAPYLLRDASNRQSERIYDVRDVDPAMFEGWETARANMLVVQQQAGETIFVPSNWYHQVENDTECISLNHNWCNSVNLPSLYLAMKEEVEDVSHAISDVKDMIRASHAKPSPTFCSSPAASQLNRPPPLDSPTNDAFSDWETEWLEEVDKLVRMDAGWGWQTFFEMIEQNLLRILELERGQHVENINSTTAPEHTIDKALKSSKRGDFSATRNEDLHPLSPSSDAPNFQHIHQTNPPPPQSTSPPTLTSTLPSTSTSTRPPTLILQPPVPFILTRIKSIMWDFRQRREYLKLGTVRPAVDRVMNVLEQYTHTKEQ